MGKQNSGASGSKGGFFDSRLMSSKVKSANVKFFPEAVLGYLGGPFFALVPNGIINTFLTQYWKNVLGLNDWAAIFTWLMPLISTVLIIVGNLLVGRLMERKPKKAGKARPLLFLSIPLVAIALVALFLAPFPYNGTVLKDDATPIITLIVTAVGYNLFYAVGWPMYYTSHSAMVNLSTRNGSQRSLLATLANAAQVGSAGVAGMAGGYLTTLFTLVPSEADEKYWVNIVRDASNNITSYDVDYDKLTVAREGANGRWMIVLIILLAFLIIGCLLEYFFTRERITEEQVAANVTGEAKEVKKVSMGTQMKICLHDKYWWLIIGFFLLYQLGGMLKNCGQPFYSEAWTGNLNMSSTIGIAGAIPTAAGMVVIWPLANKFGKANSIKVGALLAALFGLIGFIPLIIPGFVGKAPSEIAGAINGIAIAGFVLKALGTVPAMYISMALLADVLDHQEAIYGIRTDGFTMAVYGSIMIAMTGIANAIILGISGAVASNLELNRTAMTFLFFGGEVIAYLAIALMFLLMNVEKFSKHDQEVIIAAQKKACEKQGIEYVDPETRMRLEEEEAEKEAEEARLAELKKKCEKEGLTYELELAKYKEAQANAKAEADRKKAEADAKKAEKEAAAKAKQEAKLAAMSEEKKAKIAAKEAKIAAQYEEERRKGQEFAARLK